MKNINSKRLGQPKFLIALFFLCLAMASFYSAQCLDSINSENPMTQKTQIEKRIILQSLQKTKTTNIEKILWLYTPEKIPHHKKKPRIDNKNLNDSQNSTTLNKTLLPEEEQIFNELNILNIKSFAQKDNYKVIEINESNYQKYISPQNANKIKNIVEKLKDDTKRKDKQNHLSEVSDKQSIVQVENQKVSKQTQQDEKSQSELQTNATTKKIIKRLIIYFAILQNGGIFINNRATLVEPLDQWIQNLPSFPFINPNIKPKNNQPYCLAFYNDSFSSMKENILPQNKVNGQNFAVLYSNVEDYFLACGKGNMFLGKLLDTYTELLIKGKQWKGFKVLNKDQKLIGLTNTDLINQHGHIIASHFVLQQEQERLNKANSSNQLAVSSLSLYKINSRLGPQKLLNQFSIESYKTYIYLLKLSIEELQIFIGPLKFLFVLEDQVVKYVANQFLKYQSTTNFVEKNSFFHTFWVKHLIEKPINQKLKNVWQFVQTYKVVQEALNKTNPSQQNQMVYGHTQIQIPQVKRITFDETKPKWQSLDKNIWIIWDNGIEGNSNLIVELCYQNLKRSAQKSGFEINSVSKSEIDNFISPELLLKISHAIKNSSFDLGSQAISDLWRLALVYEHGGVYFDASTYMMDESFDWIAKVTQFPEHLIWNRYGNEPEVFMFWNAYYCNAVDWHIDRKYKVRAQWQLSLESNFIAAVKGSQLIKQWLQVMLQWITLPFEQVQKQMKAVGMYENRWTSDSFWHQGRYLTVMDAIKYVLGRREKLIENQKYIKLYQNSGDYYKLWSIPGQFIGQQKLRGQTNYDNRDYRLEKQTREIDNIYKYQYPMADAQKILGPLDFQGKFFNWELIMMNKMLIEFYEKNKADFSIQKLSQIIHPQSVVSVKLLNRYPEKTLELLKHYSELSAMKLKVKGFNRIWSY